MKNLLVLLVISTSLTACGGSLADATSTPDATPSAPVEITSPPQTVTPSTPDPDDANRIVCETIRSTVSGSLADAVDAYNSGVIGLYDLGTIYKAWASGARGINSSASGSVRSNIERLISLADQTGNAAESGRESAAVDGIVAFSNALDPLSVSCP